MAAPTFVQGISAGATASSTTIANTLTGVAAGNLIAVWVGWEDVDTTVTVSDGTDTLTAGTRANNGGAYGQWHYLLSANSGTRTYTATFGSSSPFRGLLIQEFNSSDGPWSLDAEAAGGGSGTACTAGPITTTGTSVVALAGAKHYASGTFSGETIDSVSATVPAHAPESTIFNTICYRLLTTTLSSASSNITRSSSSNWASGLIAFKAGAAATTDQEGFRFGADDGSESAHTWLAAQDSSLTRALGSSFLLRSLVNATGDPASTAYTLYAQKNGTGGYTAVPVGSGSTVAPTIEAGDFTSSGNNTATTSWAVSLPAYVSGDLIVIHLASDANVTHTFGAAPNSETVNSLIASFGGTAQRLSIAWFVGTATTGATTLTVTPSATEQWTAEVLKVPAGEFNASTPIQTNTGSTNQTTAVTDIATPTWTADATAGGRVVVAASIDVLTATAAPTGWTLPAATDRGAVGIMVGVRDAANTASESIASASFTKASETHSIAGYIINGVAVTNQLYIPTSANIAAGGEATTARLTAPSGKTTGDFVTGRRWDDENGTDSIDITADDYTEVEWALTTQSPATNGDYWDLRVYAGGSALTSYTVTPRVTIGTASTHTLTADSGSFTLTGAATGLTAQRNIGAGSGTFVLTGAEAFRDFAMAATVGSFTVTGADVTLTYTPVGGYTLVAEGGSYTLTGADVGLAANRVVTADSGSFTLTGADAGLASGRKIAADSGSYALAGADAGLKADRTLALGAGSFTLTGADVGLAANRSIAADSGSFTLTGQDAGLAVDRTLAANSGSFALTGADVGLTYTPAVGSYTLTAEAGSFTLSGADSGLAVGRNLVAGAGDYTLTGTGLTLSVGYGPIARPGSDASAGAWLPSTGSDLFAMLDEVTPDDSDYIQATSATTCEIGLRPVVDPGTSRGQAFSYRVWSPEGNGVIVRLKQGATTIATWTHDTLPTAATTYARNLTASECDAITDYTALSVEFEATV